jgi:hypothetical protein
MADQIISRLLLGLDTREFRNGIRNADRELQSFSKNIQNIGNLIGASFAVSVIQDFTLEAVKLGDQLTAAEQGFRRFGDAADLDELRKSTQGVVTDLQLMQQAIQAGNFGIPIKELGNLFKFAQMRAKETGVEVNYLVESIVTGIGRKSTRVLDNLGITAIALKEKLGGVSAEAASIADVTKAVSEIASEEIGKMGNATTDATTEVAQFGVEWQNFKAELGQTIAPAIIAILRFIKKEIKDAGQFVNDLAEGFGNVLNIAARVVTGNAQLGANSEFLKRGVNYEALYKEETGNTKANDSANNYKSIFDKLNAPNQITTLGSLKEKLAELQKQFEQTDVSTARFSELNKEIGKLQDRINKLTRTKVTKALSFVDPVADTDWLAEIRQELFAGTMSWLQYDEAQREALDPSALENYISYHQDMEDEVIPGIVNLVAEYNRLNGIINATASTIGNVLQQSFSAALVNGEDFFNVLLDGLKKMALQLAATAGAALALSVILKSIGIGGGAGIGQLFRVVGGQMGLPGLGGSAFNPNTGLVENLNFTGRVSGSDLLLNNTRNLTNYGRSGG